MNDDDSDFEMIPPKKARATTKAEKRKAKVQVFDMICVCNLFVILAFTIRSCLFMLGYI